MSLRFAILGLLARKPLTGYDLRKQFDSSVSFFWSAKHSQIYPELSALTREKLVTFQVVPQTAKPTKKVYTITPAGRTALEGWVAADLEPKALRDTLLMKVWTLGTVDPSLVLCSMQQFAAELETRRFHLETLEASLTQTSVEDAHHIGPRLALTLGKQQCELYQRWLDSAIQHLSRQESQAEPPTRQ